ncbi:GNAT family N-acetyltransferase [Jannaschia seohaensis]|uniref:Protein N-acetyltransferase, RimJ/RimL family n=1 Tax=Jannaschia seohaensis TaxID=475081 RepID=A0A2Y9B2K7_9RHOB|nr:GNAT family N-acetyltransferase [Jannaschia seohaensis]PWJ16186.1 RimJ/RimL family protein N-acetyltransferase [Jannaschia seohaensis]SSA49197.1 Protein N-acetyltransferase, RimJ/RimL family [Jannaschia seohaensis]
MIAQSSLTVIERGTPRAPAARRDAETGILPDPRDRDSTAGEDPMIPTLTTDRLILRVPELADFDAYAAFRADAHAMAWLGGPIDREAAWHQFCALLGQWRLRGHGRWIVTRREEPTPRGLVGLFEPIDWPAVELSWATFPGSEGHGLAYEASRAARRWWHAQGKPALVSHVAPRNTRSVALARRLGCTPGETMPHPTYGETVRWHHPEGEAA